MSDNPYETLWVYTLGVLRQVTPTRVTDKRIYWEGCLPACKKAHKEHYAPTPQPGKVASYQGVYYSTERSKLAIYLRDLLTARVGKLERELHQAQCELRSFTESTYNEVVDYLKALGWNMPRGGQFEYKDFTLVTTAVTWGDRRYQDPPSWILYKHWGEPTERTICEGPSIGECLRASGMKKEIIGRYALAQG